MSQEKLMNFKKEISRLSELINLDKNTILNLQNKEDFQNKIGLSVVLSSPIIILLGFTITASLIITIPLIPIVFFNFYNKYKVEKNKKMNESVFFNFVKGEEENGEINVLKKKIQSKLVDEPYLLRFLENNYKKDLIKLFDILETNNLPLIYFKKIEVVVDNLYNINYSNKVFRQYEELLNVNLNKIKEYREKIQKEFENEISLPDLSKIEDKNSKINIETIEDKNDKVEVNNRQNKQFKF